MAYRVALTPKASEELADFPDHVRKRVARWIDRLASNSRCPESRKLWGREDLYRVHAGKDHIINYEILGGVVLVVRIADRKEVYRRLSERRKG